ncbi:hypothetical protein G7Z17_g92 [Cylindrodendrum hubeiense]|uniref:mitogen-activated protein kinase kinase n=1 Tax=Cylindrodendrum hubeiense TaxID=595255 RepID=A0A9P5HQL7_9HYPO|nr:hypothetical protein G7Z17_g92 [Cylindrodendrum hubeiense]
MGFCRILAIGLLQSGFATALKYADNQVKVVKDSEAASIHFKDVDDVELYSPAFLNSDSISSQFENGTSGPTDGVTMDRNDWMTYHNPNFKSDEGRSIPYVFLSASIKPESANSTASKKVRVWLQGGVHGNEPAGDQALLALLGKLDANTTWAASLLEKLDIMMLPRYNPDGVAYFQRYLATNLDPNRDHTKLASQQTRDIKELVMGFAPHVGVDCHEYSANRGYGEDSQWIIAADGLFSAMKNLNIHSDIRDLAEGVFAPRIEAAMESRGLRWAPYVTGDPGTAPVILTETGSEPRIGDTSVALNQAVMFLTETRGIMLADQHFQRRVATGLTMVETIVQTAADLADDVCEIVEGARAKFISSDDDIIITDYARSTNITWTFLDLESSELVDVPVEFFNTTPVVANLTRTRPEAYLIPRAWAHVAARLETAGVEVETLKFDFRGEVEALNITSSVLASSSYEGVALNTVTTETIVKKISVPAGSFWVSTRQKNAAHAFVTLEPEGVDSYTSFAVIPLIRSSCFATCLNIKYVPAISASNLSPLGISRCPGRPRHSFCTALVMATRLGAFESRVSDLVVDSKIEATWDPEAKHTTQIRTAVGVSARRRRLKTEEKWERKRRLGRGAYGTVWLEKCIESSGPRNGESDLRAVKEIHKLPNVSTSEFHRELEAIAKFSHERFVHCFVRSLGWFENETTMFITMEYLKYGDLQQYLTKPFPEPEARQIALQVVEALHLMHDSGFAHRDLKPGNILVFQKGPSWWVKIADFGISKRVEASTALRTMEIGTRGFMAPEILGLYCPDDFDETEFEADEAAHDALAYTPAIDLWALGEITHRMLTQKPAFVAKGRLWSYVTKGTPFPATELESVGASVQGISFIQEAMAASPKKRLTAANAISHEWLESHEFLEETSSRSIIESTRETPALDLTAFDYEPSAQWTVTDQQSESTVDQSIGIAGNHAYVPHDHKAHSPDRITGSSPVTFEDIIERQTWSDSMTNLTITPQGNEGSQTKSSRQTNFIPFRPTMAPAPETPASEIRSPRPIMTDRATQEAAKQAKPKRDHGEEISKESLEEYTNFVRAGAFTRKASKVADEIKRPRRPVPTGKRRGNVLSEFPETMQALAICALRSRHSRDMHGVDILGFDDSTALSEIKESPFLFVEYSMDEFDHNSVEDMTILHRTAEEATRELGLWGYWGVLGRRRTPETIRTPAWAVNDIVDKANNFLYIFRGRQDINHRHSLSRAIGQHLGNWIGQFSSIPIFVASLAKPVFQIRYDDGASPRGSPDSTRFQKSTLSRTEIVSCIWNDQTGDIPSVVQRVLDEAKSPTSTPAPLTKLMCLMELLGRSVPTSPLHHTYLEVVRDFCPIRPELDRKAKLFDTFVKIFLANPQLGLLERWFCTPQFNLCRPWEIKELLGTNGEWDGSENLTYLFQATSLADGQTIRVKNGLGYRLEGFEPPRSRSMINVFKKWTGRADQRFLVAYGLTSVDDLNKCIPGLKGNKLMMNPLSHDYKEAEWMSNYTLVDLQMNLVTFFKAFVAPTHIIICGMEEGMENSCVLRAMLCSYRPQEGYVVKNDQGYAVQLSDDERPMAYYKENTVRIQGISRDGLHEMGEVQMSPRSSNTLSVRDQRTVYVGTGQKFINSAGRDKEPRASFMEHFFEV